MSAACTSQRGNFRVVPGLSSACPSPHRRCRLRGECTQGIGEHVHYRFDLGRRNRERGTDQEANASPPVHDPSRGSDEPEAHASRAAMTWMQRLRRVYDIDVSVCPNCGGALKVLAVITQPPVITSILAHLSKRETRAPPVAA